MIITIGQILAIFIFVLFPCYILIKAYIKSKIKTKKIKEIYEKDHKALYFYDQKNIAVFEEALARNSIPGSWIVRINEENKIITGITYSDGRSVGIIACQREAMLEMIGRHVNVQNRIDRYRQLDD